MSMKVKFWGTRGSIPTPQPDRMKYGGDTACVEVRTDDGERIIFDAGTGIRRLGLQILKEGPERPISLFLSHTHWDHIQGFPFFLPIYDKRFRFKIYGPLRMDEKMEFRLHVQMSDLFFPVKLSAIEQTMEFVELVEDPFTIGAVKITPRHLHHPLGCMGYRIEHAGKVITYATDNEHEPGTIAPEIAEISRDADCLIYDAHFTDEELPRFKGWGHSTWQQGVRIAQTVGVKTLVLFHHDPNHDDAFLDRVAADAKSSFPGAVAATRDLELEF